MLRLLALLILATTPAHAQEATLDFAAPDTQISEEHKALLTKNIIPKLQSTPKTALEVHSYARSQTQSSAARRLSLTRALAVREFLTTQNIKKERIYLHPLGNKAAPENPQTDFITLKIIQQ